MPSTFSLLAAGHHELLRPLMSAGWAEVVVLPVLYPPSPPAAVVDQQNDLKLFIVFELFPNKNHCINTMIAITILHLPRHRPQLALALVSPSDDDVAGAD